MRIYRIMMALTTCLFIFTLSSGYAELLCINAQEYSALLDPHGSEIIRPGEYDDIFCVIDDRAYALGKESDQGMKYALCDGEGNLLTECIYEMFSASDDVILFRQSGRYGSMDGQGRILLAADYTQLVTNGAGGYLAMDSDPYDDEPDEILYINERGEVLQTSVYSAEGLSRISDGRMPFRTPSTEKYGYVDEQGRVAVEPEFSYAGTFDDGMARASHNDLFGVLAPSGSWLISPKYSYMEIGEKIIGGLQGRETCVVWDKGTCSELFRMDGRAMNVSMIGDYPVIMNGEKVYVYAQDGSLLLERDMNATITRGVGDQLLLSEGDWGAWCTSIVTGEGVMLERRDQYLLPLDDELYLFLMMDVTAYDSQTLGDIRYSCDYDSIRYGLLDTEGNEILPAEYLDILRVGKGRYLLLSEDGERVIDAAGEILWSRLKE